MGVLSQLLLRCSNRRQWSWVLRYTKMIDNGRCPESMELQGRRERCIAAASILNMRKKIGEGYYEPKSIDLQDDGARCSGTKKRSSPHDLRERPTVGNRALVLQEEEGGVSAAQRPVVLIYITGVGSWIPQHI
jgi:hypothetical protein